MTGEPWTWILALGVIVLGAALLLPQGPLPHPKFVAPAPGAEVGLPVRVVLTGLPDGAHVGLRVVDSYGRVLVEDEAVAKDGRAETELYYDLPASPRGRVEAFLPVVGLDHIVFASQAVHFAVVPYSWAEIYFLDPQGEPFPLVRRVPRTSAVATQALKLLLAGPTWRERARGYWSALPQGAELLEISISGGVADVRLSPDLLELAPELRALAARQVEATLRQFPTVSEVRVYAGGEPLSP